MDQSGIYLPRSERKKELLHVYPGTGLRVLFCPGKVCDAEGGWLGRKVDVFLFEK